MSAKTIKRNSGWAHKHGEPAVEMHELARSLDGFVFTQRGYVPGSDYEDLRLAQPELNLPAFESLPLLDALQRESYGALVTLQ